MKISSSPPPGFTLLETMLALGLVGICLALTFPFLAFQRELWHEQQAFREEHAAIASALQWIARDLQEAGCGLPGPPLAEAGGDRLAYTLSRAEDDPGDPAAGDRRLITLSHRGDRLVYRIQAWDPETSRWKRGSSHTLARGVVKVSFAGLDASGEEVVSAGRVTSVEVTVVGRRTGTLGTTVTLRNRRGSPVR